ncbi:MAG: hypothetical protein J1F01_06960 [Oscillospiraceae bacterium]|nr:hypothetical protein [Oscillospiraceae bacterium]
MFEILKREKQTANDSDIIYPEESNGLIDVRKVIEENTGGYGFIPDAEFAAIEDTDIHSFIPYSDLSMSEDIYRPVFIPNAAGLAQAEYGQVGRGINENAVDKATESGIITSTKTLSDDTSQLNYIETGYKGGTTSHHSIEQNIPIISKSYNYTNGYFGEISPSTGNRTRNIFSNNNLSTAKDFYNKIALGGKEQIYSNNLKITSMSDGTIISFRVKSYSDGTPVVEINIKRSTNTGGIKQQKIHFVGSDN